MPTPVSAATSNAAMNASLLATAHSQHSIYELTRMSGEGRHRHHVLPVDCAAERSDCCTDGDATEDAYAHSLASMFGSPSPAPTVAPHSAMPRSGYRPRHFREAALDAALLQLAHSQRTIYEKSRISGENHHKHHMLPTDRVAERSDRCSDATDSSYANAMANYFMTSSSSRL